MKYILLSAVYWRVIEDDDELREFLSKCNKATRFENGLSALSKGWSPNRMLGYEFVIVPIESSRAIVPLLQEVETVTKATKWVLPPVEQPQPEKKPKQATVADIGSRVVGRHILTDDSFKGPNTSAYGTLVAINQGEYVIKVIGGAYCGCKSAEVSD